MAATYTIPLDDASDAILQRITRRLNRQPVPPASGDPLTEQQVLRRHVRHWLDSQREAMRDERRLRLESLYETSDASVRAQVDALLGFTED